MFAKLVGLSLISVLAVACSKSDSGGGGTLGPGTGPNGGGATIFGTAKKPSNGGSVIGTWQSAEGEQQGVKLVWRYDIRANRFTSATKCTYPDGSFVVAEASVAAKVDVANSTIEILEDKEVPVKAKAPNDSTCLAKVVKQSARFTVTDGKIFYFDQEGNQRLLSEEKISD